MPIEGALILTETLEKFESIRPLSHDELIGEIEDVMVECALDTAAFAKTFMPHRFERPFDKPYKELFNILDDDTIDRAAIAAPRGTGKTSCDAIAFPARKICYQDCKFVVVVSATHGLGAKIVKQLGRELTENPNIKKVFGELKGSRWAEGEGDLRTSTGINILARGAGQQVRGLLEEGRPDLIILDDLEDSEPFRIGDATDYVRKTWEWLRTDLLNIIDRSSLNTRIIYLGTVLGENSILQRLLENPRWKSIRLELCDDNYVSNYPNYMTTEQVRELAEDHREEGDLDFFFREYRNIPIAGETAVFRREHFKYWDMKVPGPRSTENPDPQEVKFIDTIPYLEKAVIVDPAKTVNIASAESAVLGIGFSASKKAVLQLDCIHAKLEPDEIYNEAWMMAQRLGTYIIACETTSLELFIEMPFNAFLRLKGYPPIVPLKAQGHKQDRIRELSPFYRLGYIYHHPDSKIHAPLENQLLAFPRSKLWDVMDAWAYFLKLFHLSNRMFIMDEQEDAKAFEEELAMLDKMDEGLEDFDSYALSP